MCYRSVPDVSKVVFVNFLRTACRSGRDRNSVQRGTARLRNLVAAYYTTRTQATVMYRYSPRVFSAHYGSIFSCTYL